MKVATLFLLCFIYLCKNEGSQMRSFSWVEYGGAQTFLLLQDDKENSSFFCILYARLQNRLALMIIKTYSSITCAKSLGFLSSKNYF